MALSRVPGYSLLANLDRQGTDLSLTSSGLTLFYWDVTNYRVGINTSTPLEPLHVEGNIFVANGNVYTSGNLTYDLGTPTNQWRNLYAGNVEAVNVNLSGTISIGGNITITGNTNGGVIYADELYDSNNRVLTTNTNFTLSGDVTGTGTYNGISLTIANTSVVAGTYGDYNQVPQIVVNNKGQVTGVTNVAIVLTQIGNITVNDTTISTASNITLAPANGYIFANNSIVSNVANPVSNTDVVTLQYLNSALSNVAGSLTSYDSSIVVNDNNVDPSYIITTVDGVVTSNVFVNSVDYYVGVNIGAINIAGNTILSSGNLLLNAQGTGIVQFVGDDAVLLPVGDDTARPTNPTQGYFRYNSERDNIEFYNGTDWVVPGAASITSDIINPDGVGNIFSLSSNATTSGVLVSINGTLQQPITAYTIVNNNQIQFTEVPLTSDTVEVRHITVSASSISKLAYGPNQIELDATAINVTGNVIPSANVTYSLGSETNQWKDLWVSNNTIYIGGTAVSVSNGQLQVGGVTANVFPDGLSSGNITVTGAQRRIIGDFGNTAKAQRLLFQSDTVSSTSVGIINNGGSYSELMLYSDSECLAAAGAIQAFADEVRIKTYNFGGDEIPLTLFVGSTPVVSLGTDYSTTLGGNLAVTGTISSGTWSAGTISTAHGGTGATTPNDALTNLLPSGAQTGYVLTTGGSGSYYWAAGSGGGGASVGQSLTTLRQSNTASAGQTVFNLVGGTTYTPGAGQLRVYINGVRQFPDAYTETSANSYTLSTGVSSGAVVFAEIDAFGTFNNFANLTYASNVGNITASGLTVQSAIESLENNKAPLAHPVFTGVTTIGGNLVVQGNLFINGNVTSINANNLNISDSLIYLADDNPADTLDIGIVSAFTDAVRYQHTGFVRDATDGVWKLFANVVAEPITTVDFTNATYANLQVGNLITTNDVIVNGNISATVSGYSIGYRDLPQITAGNVTLALTDSGKHYYANAGYVTTLTVPSNANVAFPIGTTVVVINKGTGNVSISKQVEASMYLAGNSTSTTRTLTSYGMATLIKTATNEWFINGSGLV